MIFPRVDYARIGRAVAFYERAGFQYREVPWFLRPEITAVTLPADGVSTSAVAGGEYLGDGEFLGDLPGSAEQSFLQEIVDGKLSAGRFVAVTPCFRREPHYNVHSQPYFMKVELIHIYGSGTRDIYTMAETAFRFFAKETEDYDHLQFEPQPGTAVDIVLNGVEIGSYGERRHGNFSWVYGTGLAEPRFSTVR